MKKQISFTQIVKEEIAETFENNKNVKPLLASYIRVNGSLVLRDKQMNIIMNTENAKIAKLIYSKIKENYGDDVHLSFLQTKYLLYAIRPTLRRNLQIYRMFPDQ